MLHGNEDLERSWSLLLGGSSVRPADQTFFRFDRVPSAAPDGSLSLAIDSRFDVWVTAAAVQHLEEVAGQEGIYASRAAGERLRAAWFRPGLAVRWDDLGAQVTGAPLGPQAMLERTAQVI